MKKKFDDIHVFWHFGIFSFDVDHASDRIIIDCAVKKHLRFVFALLITIKLPVSD